MLKIKRKPAKNLHISKKSSTFARRSVQNNNTMSDYEKIMESFHNLEWLILGVIVDIILLIILGAFAIELMIN